MTRRILVGLLGLVLLLLVGAVLPLGLETAAHYRSDYADATLAQAKSLASVAEERIGDHEADAPLHRDLGRLVSQGEGAQVLGSTGNALDRSGITFTLPGSLRTTTTDRSLTVHAGDETLLLAAVPIDDGARRVGVVALARPTGPLEARIRTLWLTLAVAAAVATAAAVLLALWLSRWVSRPLRRLEEAAHVVGAGHLEARAGVENGPPEVRRLAAAFDTMAGRLSILVDGHRAVIADVSHQLRTPMSALRLRLELLPELETSDPTELAGALDELNRLSRLVDGLLAVARAEATTSRPSPVDIRAVVAERVTAWNPLAAERGVALTVAPGPAVQAWAVPDHLDQVLDNLLGNCFDLEPPPTNVRLDVATDGDNALVTVRDDGPGMPAHQRAQAFQRFATGHADTGGTGLGLAIVHRLITAAGGRVRLDETPGGGLSVELSLPRVLDARPARHGWSG